MKTISITASDDKKLELLADFLREVGLVITEEKVSPAKKMNKLPLSVLHPIEVTNFMMFNRDELHDR